MAAGLLANIAVLIAIRENSRQDLEASLHQRADLVANVVHSAAKTASSPRELQQVVAAFATEPDIHLVVAAVGDPPRVVACNRQAWLGLAVDELPDPRVRERLTQARQSHSTVGSYHRIRKEYTHAAPLRLSQPAIADASSSEGASLVELDARLDVIRSEQAAWHFSAACFGLLIGLFLLGYRLLRTTILDPMSAISRAVRAENRGRSSAWRALPVDDEIGQLARTLQQALQQADEALREQRSHQFAVDQHCIVAVTDTQGRITHVNDRFCAISHYPREELIGRTHRVVNSRHHPPAFFAEMWARIGRGEVWRGEICNVTRHGSLYWVDTTIVPLPGPHGKPAQYIAIRTDITALKQAEEAVRQTNRELELATARANQMAASAAAASAAKSEFLATMSHEIRTPMNGVIGFTNLLLDSPLSDEQREHAVTIKHSGELLLTIINDILDFSKIEAGKMVVEIVPVDVSSLVDEVVTLLAASAREKGLALQSHGPLTVTSGVAADPVRVRQVLLNLVGNALKFTPPGGRVTVHVDPADATATTAPTPARLRIRVVDSGIGIPPEKVATLFNKFSQADSSTTRKFGGTGLGLAISKRLVELMRGEIGLESEPGQGATFWFTLPTTDRPLPPASRRPALPTLPDPRGQATPIVPLQLPAGRADKPRILVVEDTMTNQLLAQKMLKRFGCEAEIANDGREAVARFQELPFDAILMDCHMPEMDGFEATAEIRRLEQAARDGRRPVPIIALTANAMQGDEERCRRAGMDDYLAKPFSPEKLKLLLERWVGGAGPTVAP